MGLELYPDQIELVDEVRAAMRRTKSVLLQSATGSGKTAMATYMVQSARDKNFTTVFTVPRRDLLEQTSDTFLGLDIPHSYVAAGKLFNPYSKVYVGMIDSMVRRLDKLPRANLLIVDETHYGDAALEAVINVYKAMGAWVVGLSATPWKLSGKGLGCWYNEIVQGKSIDWLIKNKRLSDYRYFYGHSKPDFSKIKVTAGDYAKGELADFMEHQGVIIGDCVNDYRKRCMGRIHIVRCASIKHSQMVAEQFRNAGIPAMHVDGETKDRKPTFRAFARRELLVLTFCDLLNFGFDLSQASGGMNVCIESGSDLKPSKSLAGQMQFWGRMLRYKLEAAIINDHVNNYLEHELPSTEREYTLSDRIQGKKSQDTERAIPVRQCKVCHFVHPPAPVCPNCQSVYPIQSREIEEVDGELFEIDRENFTSQKKVISPEKMQTALDAMIRNAVKKGMPREAAAKWAAKKVTQQAARAR